MSKPTDTNGTPDLAAAVKELEARCAELERERDALRADLVKLRGERDSYAKAVGSLMAKESSVPSFSREEMLAFVGQEPPLEELIAELEREMRSGA
jgi:hypothetical protein